MNPVLHMAWTDHLSQQKKKKNLKNAMVSCCEKSLFVDSEMSSCRREQVNKFFRCRILFVVPEMLEQRYKVKFYQRVCVLFSPLLRQQSSQQVSSLPVNPLCAVTADFISQLVLKVITCFVDS